MIFDDKLYKIEESIVRYMDNDYKGEFMTNVFLAAMDGGTIGMIVVLVVLMVLMFAMSIIPQRKRQKKAQEMMNSITVGTKVKTIGGFVGEVKKIDNMTNTFTLDLSAEGDGSTLVVIDRSAIYTVMEMTKNAEGETTLQEKPEVTAMDDIEADKVAAEKKSAKKAKKEEESKEETVEQNDSLEKKDNETLLKD